MWQRLKKMFSLNRINTSDPMYRCEDICVRTAPTLTQEQLYELSRPMSRLSWKNIKDIKPLDGRSVVVAEWCRGRWLIYSTVYLDNSSPELGPYYWQYVNEFPWPEPQKGCQ